MSTITKELTFGQKKAGLRPEDLESDNRDLVVFLRKSYARIFDVIQHKIENTTDDEVIRLGSVAIDEAQNNMRSAIRALTFGR